MALRLFRNRLKGLRQIISKRYQRAKQRAAKNYKPLRGPNKISRRQFLTRAAIGTAGVVGAYLGARKVRERIPFWLGAKKRYTLLMYFQDHIGGSFDPKEALEEIKNAKQRGEPYHVFFMEHAGSSNVDYIKIISNSEKNADLVRRSYTEFLKEGYSQKQAIDLIIKNFVESGLDKKDAELRAYLAIERIKILPIELHETKNLERINIALDNAKRKKTALLAKANACKELFEIQAQTRDFFEEYNTANKIRDLSFHDLEKRFLDAQKFFPELSKLPQIRAIGSLGTAHRTIYFSFNQAKSNIELIEAKLPRDFHSYSLVGYATIEKPPVPQVTQRQTRIFTLGLYLDQKIQNLMKNRQEIAAKKLFQKAIALSHEEFEQLNNLTKNILTVSERTEFITNWLLGNN